MEQKFIKIIGLMGLAASSLVSVAQDIQWGPAGPLYTAGRIRNMLVDETNPNVLYAGSTAGGIFKSNNGGATWFAMNDQGAVKNISYMAQANNVIYAATGEGFLSYIKKAKAKPGTGLYKVQNNDLLKVADSSVVGFVINRIACFGNKIAVAGNRGVLISHDNGSTWATANLSGYTTKVNTTFGMDVKFDANGILYCTIGNERGHVAAPGLPNFLNVPSKVFRSTDNGLTSFNNITPTNSALPDANYGRIELAIAPSNNNVIYASCANKNTSLPTDQKPAAASLNAIFVSYDAGNTWAIYKQGSSQIDPLTNGGSEAVGDYAHIILVNPSNPDMLFFGGYGFYIFWRSGGTNANPIVAGQQLGSPFQSLPQYYLHNNIHDIKIIGGSPNRFFFVTDAGIFRSTDISGTSQTTLPSFQPFYKGLVTGQFNSVAIERYPVNAKTDGAVTPYSGFTGGTDGNGLVYYSGTDSLVTKESNYLSGDVFATEYSKILPDAIFTSVASGAIYRSANIRTSSPNILNLNSYSGELSSLAPSTKGFETSTHTTGSPFKLWENYGQPNNPDFVMFYNDSLRVPASISGVATLTTQTTFTFDLSRPNPAARLDSLVIRTGTVAIPGSPSVAPTPFTASERKDINIKLGAGPPVSGTISVTQGTTAVTQTVYIYAGSNLNVTGSAVVTNSSTPSVMINPVTGQTIVSVTFNSPPFASKTTASISGIPDPAAYYRVFATVFFAYKPGDTVRVRDERISTKPMDYVSTLTQSLSWAFGSYQSYTLTAPNNTAIPNPTFILTPGGATSPTPTFVVSPFMATGYTISQRGTYNLAALPVNFTLIAETGSASASPTFVLMPDNITQTNPTFVVSPTVNTVYTITATDANAAAVITNSAVVSPTYVINGTGGFTQSQATTMFVVSPTVNTTYTLLGVSSDTVTGASTSTTYATLIANTTQTVGSARTPFSPNNPLVKLRPAALSARLAFFLNNLGNTGSQNAIVVTKAPLNMNDPLSLVRVSQSGCRTDDAAGAPTNSTIVINGKPVILEWSKSGTELYYATDAGYIYRVSHITDIMDLSPSSYSGKFYTDIFMYTGGNPNASTINPVSPYRTTLIGQFDPNVQATSINVSNDDKTVMVTLSKAPSSAPNSIVMTTTVSDIRGAIDLVTPKNNWAMKGASEINDKQIYCSIMEMTDNKKVFVGTDLGVYYCGNITASPAVWTKVNNDKLPNVQILDMKQQTLRAWECYNSGEIYVATNGRGVWKSNSFFYPYVDGVEERAALPSEPNKLMLFPNPANSHVTIAFNSKDGETAQAYVMDLSGRIVLTGDIGKLAGGESSYTFETERLNAGIYIVSVASDSGVKRTGKLIISK